MKSKSGEDQSSLESKKDDISKVPSSSSKEGDKDGTSNKKEAGDAEELSKVEPFAKEKESGESSDSPEKKDCSQPSSHLKCSN